MKPSKLVTKIGLYVCLIAFIPVSLLSHFFLTPVDSQFIQDAIYSQVNHTCDSALVVYDVNKNIETDFFEEYSGKENRYWFETSSMIEAFLEGDEKIALISSRPDSVDSIWNANHMYSTNWSFLDEPNAIYISAEYASYLVGNEIDNLLGEDISITVGEEAASFTIKGFFTATENNSSAKVLYDAFGQYAIISHKTASKYVSKKVIGSFMLKGYLAKVSFLKYFKLWITYGKSLNQNPQFTNEHVNILINSNNKIRHTWYLVLAGIGLSILSVAMFVFLWKQLRAFCFFSKNNILAFALWLVIILAEYFAFAYVKIELFSFSFYVMNSISLSFSLVFIVALLLLLIYSFIYNHKKQKKGATKHNDSTYDSIHI